MYNSKYVKGDYDMVNWENNIRRVVPYTPGEQPDQPDMIKLNTNENPYPPAPGVREVLRGMDTDTLRLYPDPAALDLVHAIADNYGLQDDQVFVLGDNREVSEDSRMFGAVSLDDAKGKIVWYMGKL